MMSVVSEGDETREEFQKYIPNVLSRYHVNPTDYELIVVYDKSSKSTTYTYNLRWKEQEFTGCPRIPSSEGSKSSSVSTSAKRDKKKKKKKKKCKRSQSMSGQSEDDRLPPTDANLSYQQWVRKWTSNLSEQAFSNDEISTPVGTPGRTKAKPTESEVGAKSAPTQCDGPCKKSFSPKMLSIQGRCGHFLCPACYDLVRNEDGSPGCSSFDCNWRVPDSKEVAKKRYEQQICRLQRQKAEELRDKGLDVKMASHSSRSSSIATSPLSSKTEPEPRRKTEIASVRSLQRLAGKDVDPLFPEVLDTVVLKMTLIKQDNVRMEKSCEVPAWKRLRRVVKSMAKSVDANVKDGDIYVVRHDTTGALFLVPLTKKELKKHLYDYPNRDGKLQIIIDNSNVASELNSKRA